MKFDEGYKLPSTAVTEYIMNICKLSKDGLNDSDIVQRKIENWTKKRIMPWKTINRWGAVCKNRR